ncbi:MAG: protein kinase [Thermoanaerobaculia bacterium]
MIGTKLGPYEITAKLGEGGMGEVYRAIDSHLKREVAIKVLPAAFTEDKERLARFEREAQLLAQLNHPNIAQIYGLEKSGETRALVMELVPGPTLDERLAAGPLPFAESLSIALQLTLALEEAHEKGIVHRDLKPQNIKASGEGKVKVLDFGLAKAMDSAGTASAATDLARSPTMMHSPTLTAVHGTQLGVILGTAAYMAPEQAKGQAIDKRADIWAFGVVFYEMLAGGSLFAGDSVGDTLAAVIRAEIDFSRLPAETPAAIRQLLRRCLERNPRNRLHDIADARLVLAEVIQTGGAVESTPAFSPASTGTSRREIAAWVLALVALAALGALLAGRKVSPRGAGGNAAAAPLTRFAVAPAEKGRIEGYPALSPDGRALVYALHHDDGSAALWAYSFETGVSRALAATAGGSQPFWSPDGKQLAFFAGGQLKRLDLANGLVQNLLRVADPRGGSWTREGEILCAVNAASPILRVSPASGENRAVTTLVPDKGEQSHRFPWALPGGGFLFSVTGSGESQGIFWQGRDGSPPHRLVKDVSRAAFDERGYLVWVRGSILVAQPFDPAKGELSGEPFPLAEKIGLDSQTNAETWFAASTSGTIALRQGARQHTELLWVDRKGAPLGAPSAPASYSEPAISPDGRQVAVAITLPEESGNLWLFDAGRLDRGRRLTFDPSGCETPSWSPDSRWVAYTSPRARGFALFRKAADGSGEEELLFESGPGSWIDSWSPDGISLVFERFESDGGSDLWLLPLDGERKPVPFLQTPANEAHATFSPDGRFVAYTSDESGVSQLYVRTAAASGSRWQVSLDGGDWASWSPDGKELYFGGPDRILRAVKILSLAPFAFGNPEPLFRLRTPAPAITSNRTYFAPNRDGSRFLVNQLVGEEGSDRIEVLMNWSPPAQR